MWTKKWTLVKYNIKKDFCGRVVEIYYKANYWWAMSIHVCVVFFTTSVKYQTSNLRCQSCKYRQTRLGLTTDYQYNFPFVFPKPLLLLPFWPNIFLYHWCYGRFHAILSRFRFILIAAILFSIHIIYYYWSVQISIDFIVPIWMSVRRI